MPQLTMAANPFRLMLEPEAVIAAVEKSERLGALNRHLCRPLDRPLPGAAAADGEAALSSDDADRDD